MTPSVQVFLLCHNRPDFLGEVIPSILAQTGVDFELIVSDNSTDDRVFETVSLRWPALEIRRRKGLTGIQHLNLLFSEASAEFLVLFHDDDRMLDGFLCDLHDLMDKHPTWGAVAPNAFILRSDRRTTEPFNSEIRKLEIFENPLELGRKYLMPSRGLNPFPGYMYRTSKTRGLQIDARDANKYSDVVFLMKVAERAPIAWSALPLMDYRLHSENDSGVLDLRGSMKIRLHLMRRGMSKDDFELQHFRHWRHLLALRKFPLTPWRRRTLRRACLFFFARHSLELTRFLLGKVRRALAKSVS